MSECNVPCSFNTTIQHWSPSPGWRKRPTMGSIWVETQTPTLAHIVSLYVHMSHSLQYYLLWDKDSNVGRGKKSHLKGTETVWYRPSGLLLQTGDQIPPLTGQWQQLSKKQYHITYGASSSSSVNRVTSYKGDSCQHTMRKHPLQIQPLYHRHWAHSIYIGLPPHK